MLRQLRRDLLLFLCMSIGAVLLVSTVLDLFTHACLVHTRMISNLEVIVSPAAILTIRTLIRRFPITAWKSSIVYMILPDGHASCVKRGMPIGTGSSLARSLETFSQFEVREH